MNKKVVASILLFIVVLICATYSAYGQDGARVSVGHTAVNSESTVGEIGYEINGWELAAMHIGDEQGTTTAYSLSHIVRPDWHFLGATNYYRIGIVDVNGSYLVAEENFRLGVGLEWEFFALEYFHFSNANTAHPNTGIDGVQVRLKIPFGKR